MLKHGRSSPITYSQYFIAKRHLAEQLVNLISQEYFSSSIIEIGPGTGRLTEFLVERSKNVTAVEVDYNFWKRLKTRFGKHANILCGDFLDYELPSHPYIIVSNLPFFLANKIIRKLLTARNRPTAIYAIVQKEMVQELVQQAKSLFYDVRILHHMKRADFEPMPRAQSVFIEIVTK